MPFLHRPQVHKLAALTGHRDCVYALAGMPGAGAFYSAGADGLVAAWSTNEPERDGELVAKVDNSVYALLHLPAAGLLVLGHNFQGVQAIDLEARKLAYATALPPVPIFDLVADIARQRLYAALGDGTLAVLRLADFQVETLLRLSDKSLRCLALHETRGELAVGGSDWRVRILDADTLTVKHVVEGATNSVFTAAYSPDGHYLLTAGRDAHLRAWDVEAGYQEHRTLVAHMFTINHLAFSPDGSLLATCSMDKSIKLWDAATLDLLRVVDRARHAGHGTSVNKLFWPAQQNRLVSCSDDRTLAVWQLSAE
ncbi:WD40 repeat domain-containing protein [Hymenobacter weizhouensis]|uniref:WD40 repeat domain-containing protein n=1 Tax=Hymenobacter sp. YIM 151500-1 TaxID=2987689 RepID=UPI0022262BEF|nr:cytochrome D1 domain-containing protein [Hymenobacter sp. YIM 151500-1]UYZ63217.1 WD40 repeat domain-containing protein [Hymenobacter sp. YIM 151500-1]